MRMNLESWSDSEVFNFIQILLEAKFDLGKSVLISGSPLINEILEELFKYKMQDHGLSQIRQKFLDEELSEESFAVILGALSLPSTLLNWSINSSA